MRLCATHLEPNQGQRGNKFQLTIRGGENQGHVAWGCLDNSYHIVTTAFMVWEQCFRNRLYKTVEWPTKYSIFISMIPWEDCLVSLLKREGVPKSSRLPVCPLFWPKIFFEIVFRNLHILRMNIFQAFGRIPVNLPFLHMYVNATPISQLLREGLVIYQLITQGGWQMNIWCHPSRLLFLN